MQYFVNIVKINETEPIVKINERFKKRIMFYYTMLWINTHSPTHLLTHGDNSEI